MSKLKIDFTREDVPVEAVSNAGVITLALDDNKYPINLRIDNDKAIEIANALLNATGEKTLDDWEEKENEYITKVNDLEEIIECKEETIDFMRNKFER